MNGQGNQEQDIQDQFHKKRHLFSRVDYIAGKNVRDSNGKFKCGLRIDMDLDADFDFAWWSNWPSHRTWNIILHQEINTVAMRPHKMFTFLTISSICLILCQKLRQQNNIFGQKNGHGHKFEKWGKEKLCNFSVKMYLNEIYIRSHIAKFDSGLI